MVITNGETPNEYHVNIPQVNPGDPVISGVVKVDKVMPETGQDSWQCISQKVFIVSNPLRSPKRQSLGASACLFFISSDIDWTDSLQRSRARAKGRPARRDRPFALPSCSPARQPRSHKPQYPEPWPANARRCISAARRRRRRRPTPGGRWGRGGST